MLLLDELALLLTLDAALLDALELAEEDAPLDSTALDVSLL